MNDLNGQRADTPEQHTVEVDQLLDRARKAGTDAEREKLANEGLAMARNLTYDEGIVRASIQLGEICARANRNEEALQHYLLVEAKVKNKGSGAKILTVYRALGDIFLGEKVISYAGCY